MKCKHCGAELQTGEQFCYRCGAVVELEPIKRHCGFCGEELEPEAAFCWKCGKEAPSTEQQKAADQADGIRVKRPVVQSAAGPTKGKADPKPALKGQTEALVLAAQSGDSDSFTELYRLYYQKVFALAKATVRMDADAEDILQTTFLKAWNNLGKLKDPTVFSTWIQRITLNQSYSLLRRKHIDVSIDDDDEDTGPIQLESELMLPEAYAERSDLKERLGKIIRELSAVQQQTITLYYFDGLPVANIAWIMDCSVSTVKSRLFLARKSIKTEIEEQERKSGQPFYGIAGPSMIPFGKLFVDQVGASSLQDAAASELLKGITEQIAGAAAKATRAVAGSAAKTAAGSAAGTANRAAAAVGVKAAAKAATTAVSGKVITGIVAAVLAVGAVTGGTVTAVNAAKKNKPVSEAVVMTAAPANTQDHAVRSEALPVQSASAVEQQSGARKHADAFRAYRDHLINHKADIDSYVWQYESWTDWYDWEWDEAAGSDYGLRNDDPDDGTMPKSRPVVLYDITDDGIPELIYIRFDRSAQLDFINMSHLVILTYRDGQLITLFDREWEHMNIFDGSSGFRIYAGSGEYKLLVHWYDGMTEWSAETYDVFTEGNIGALQHTHLLHHEHDYDEDTDRETDTYRQNDLETDRTQYDRSVGKWEESRGPLLLYSGNMSNPDYDESLSMTCDDAIAWLDEQIFLSERDILDVCLTKDPCLYNEDLAVCCAALCLSTYSGPLDSGVRTALCNYGFSKDNIISNNYSGPTMNQLGSLAYTIAIKEYKGDDAEPGEKLIVVIAQGTTNLYEMLRDVVSNTDTSLRGYNVYSIVREFKQAICEELDRSGWQTGKYKILITGHSLGGATANYLAATLIDELPGQMGKEDIYCYTFAAINSIDSDHTVEQGFENIHNIYNMYDTFSPEHFGGSLISGMGGGFGKFGHMDIYSKEHRSAADANKAAPVQIADHINHDMDKYLRDVKNGLVQCKNGVVFPARVPAEFWQSSGAGGWGEEITFRKDGTIVGEYHDWDGGWDGVGYDATMQYSSYTCTIGTIRQVNAFTYTFTVENVVYDHEVGKEEIILDGDELTNYIYTTGSFVPGARITLYTDDAPVEAIPKQALELYETATVQHVTGTMPCFVLYCEQTGRSFFSGE